MNSDILTEYLSDKGTHGAKTWLLGQRPLLASKQLVRADQYITDASFSIHPSHARKSIEILHAPRDRMPDDPPHIWLSEALWPISNNSLVFGGFKWIYQSVYRYRVVSMNSDQGYSVQTLKP